MRVVQWGRELLWVGFALLACGCAVDRSALKPGGVRATAPNVRRHLTLAPTATRRPVRVRTPRPEPARPVVPSVTMTADQLARHMGLGYEDAPSHVLLRDKATRVRIWKDSNEVSVGGRMARLPARTRRQGRSLIVPAQTVSYLEQQVYEARKRVVSYEAYRAKPVFAPFPLIVLPPPEPAAAVAPPVRARPMPPPCVEPSLPGADAAWARHARPARAWKWIVIHHSDDMAGNLAKYDRIHRETRHWDECGYHFVIGNGSMSGDGEVEVGSRWRKQKHGAHTKAANGGNQFNERGIGICLVGDFECRGRPTSRQMDNLVRLCRWLMATYSVAPSEVIGHSDCKATCCPGKNFPWGELRRRLRVR